MPLILDHVCQVYNADTEMPVRALNDVNLMIPEGQFIGIIGHTGSGKSTLVQHMNGLILPTSGSIYYNGKDITDKEFNRKELRRHVGLVFQYPEHQLFEETVFKDVCFGPKNLGLSEKDTELRSFAALKSDGTVVTSGFDISGGNPNYEDLGVSKASEKLVNVKKIVATQGAFAALTNDGKIFSWGSAQGGQLGLSEKYLTQKNLINFSISI